MVGTSGQEVVYTHEGDDFIETHGGSDFIHAGDGQDTIIFYGGEEILGGSGSDIFVLSSKHQESFDTKINDFSFDDGDVLDLRSIPTLSRDDIDTTVIDENTLELSIGNLGKITLNNIDFESDENIQSKIKDQILITENITSVEMINNAGDAVDPLSGLSGDYINFSELDAPSDVTYIDVNHGFIQVSEKVAFFQGNEDAYYNSIIGSKNVDVISGDIQGVSIHYAGFEGDDIFLGGHDDVIDYGLEERMQEFFNSYYDRPGVTVKLGDVNTPTLNELIQNTTDINTANIDAMISGTAKDTFGDTDIIEGVTKVSGTSSSDVLIGSKEGDELVGGRGDDFIYGQAGADVLTGGQGSDVFYYDISEKEYGADIIKDFNLLSDKLFIGGFDENLTDDSLAIMSGEEMFGEGWQDLGDSLYKDYVVGIEKLSGDFDAILYLEDVNYSTEEVSLLLKDILSDVAA